MLIPQAAKSIGQAVLTSKDPAYQDYLKATEDLEMAEAAVEKAKTRRCAAIDVISKTHGSFIIVDGKPFEIRYRAGRAIMCMARGTKGK